LTRISLPGRPNDIEPDRDQGRTLPGRRNRQALLDEILAIALNLDIPTEQVGSPEAL
jgi:hypothetical protein